MLIKVLPVLVFLLLTVGLYWATKRGFYWAGRRRRTRLGTWDHIATIALAGFTILSALIAILPTSPDDDPDCQITTSELIAQDHVEINALLPLSVQATNPKGRSFRYDWSAKQGPMSPGEDSSSPQSIYIAPPYPVDDRISVVVSLPGCGTPKPVFKDIAVVRPNVVSGSGLPKCPPAPGEGFRYEVIRPGDRPIPSLGSTIVMHYTGTLANGIMFESTYSRPKPYEFVYGKDPALYGWFIGIGLMRQGEMGRLVIPPDWAYGPKGVDNIIPPNATLIYVVDVIEVHQPATSQ